MHPTQMRGVCQKDHTVALYLQDPQLFFLEQARDRGLTIIKNGPEILTISERVIQLVDMY